MALSPEAAKQLIKQGFNVVVETGAGAGAKFLDADYVAAGAEVKTVKEALGSDIVFKVRLFTLLKVGIHKGTCCRNRFPGVTSLFLL